MHAEPRSGIVRGSVPELRLPIPTSGYSRPGGSIARDEGTGELWGLDGWSRSEKQGTDGEKLQVLINCTLVSVGTHGPKRGYPYPGGEERRNDRFLEITERSGPAHRYV